MSPRSADQINRRYFREAYRTGEHGWPVDDPSPYVMQFLTEVAQQIPGGQLLDIGCGEGRHAIAAARLGFAVTAIDYEPLAIERARSAARSKGVQRIRFREASVLDLPFSDSEFDVALDCSCLHHQKKSDWPRYTANLLRVLKPDGLYVLSVFSSRFHLFQGRRRKWHIADGAYRRCFTPDDIKDLFAEDFEVAAMVEERGRGFWHALLRRR